MNQTKTLAALSLFWTLSAHAGIGPELIKGVDELIDAKCQEKISPVYAMGMLKSGVLPHIRFWGSYGEVPRGEEKSYPPCRWAPRSADLEHPGRFLKEIDPNECPLDHTSALIQSLFPSHAGVGLTANQGSKDDPLSQLSPENLGHLVELLQHWSIPQEGSPDDSWTLQVYRALYPEDLNMTHTALEVLSRIQTECDKYHQEDQKISKLIENLQTVIGMAAGATQKKGGKTFNLENSLGALKETKRWKAIEPWAKILFKAVQESKKETYPYPPHTVERSLLSYLLMKGDGKEPLLRFLSSTPSCLSTQGKNLSQIFISPEGEESQKKLKEFLESRFQPSDYSEFLSHPNEGVRSARQDPDQLGYFLYQRSFSDLPPLIGGEQAAHKSLGREPQSNRKYHLYADCGEASIRNFFNIIFYDKKTRSFNPELLSQLEQKHHLKPYSDVSKKGKPGQLGVEKGLLAFYTRNQDSSNVGSNSVRDDWSRRVVSSLPGVNYLKGGGQCEMNAGVDNALKVMGALLGDSKIAESQDPSLRKSALDRLCEVVSRDGFQLSWKSNSASHPKNVDETILFSINGKPSFQWEFLPGHFSLTEIKDDSSRQADWIRILPPERVFKELGRLWNPVNQTAYSETPFSDLWNQSIKNSDVRLHLLYLAPWSQSLGSIADRFTKDLSLQDEEAHRCASVASKKTGYDHLAKELSKAPEEIRARSAAFADDMNLLKTLHPSVFSDQDPEGSTPAHLAAERGHLDVLKFLKEKAPQTLAMVDGNDSTPAHSTALEGHIEVLDFLATNAPETLSAVNRSGLTPAHFAAAGGNVETLRFLKEKAPATLRALDSLNDTPAHFAAKEGNAEALRFLAKEAPETLEMADLFGSRPSHSAALKGKAKVLSVIAETAPQTLKMTDTYGSTPAHNAAYEGQIEPLRVIAGQALETLKAVDHDGSTPTHVAVQRGSLKILKFLTEKSPQTLKMQNKKGYTPAHLAAKEGNIEALRVIAEKDSQSLRITNNKGISPAHFAAIAGNVEVLKFLAEKAPETFGMTDHAGTTAFKYIKDEALKKKVQEILDQKGR